MCEYTCVYVLCCVCACVSALYAHVYTRVPVYSMPMHVCGDMLAGLGGIRFSAWIFYMGSKESKPRLSCLCGTHFTNGVAPGFA